MKRHEIPDAVMVDDLLTYAAACHRAARQRMDERKGREAEELRHDGNLIVHALAHATDAPLDGLFERMHEIGRAAGI